MFQRVLKLTNHRKYTLDFSLNIDVSQLNLTECMFWLNKLLTNIGVSQPDKLVMKQSYQHY